MSIRVLAVLVLLLSRVVQSQIDSYECDVLPEEDGWSLFQAVCEPEQWVDAGALFHYVPLCQDFPGFGSQYDYQRTIEEFSGTSPFYAEWVVQSDGIPEEIIDVAPTAFLLWDGNALIYHFTIADEQVRFIRQLPENPILFFDITPGVPHTYRLELFGEDLDEWYDLYIDTDLVDSGVPEGALFASFHDAGIQFRTKSSIVPSTGIWQYMRWGRIADDAGGDFDSDGVVGPLDFPYFEECLLGEGIDAGPGCEWADFDFDSDVDCADWGEFVALWNDPADPPALEQCCVALPYGDVDGSGASDLDDLTCMLDGLSGLSGCVAQLDISPCGGDGDVNLRDLLNLLDALAGAPACPASCQ